jgi:hypothetical protein
MMPFKSPYIAQALETYLPRYFTSLFTGILDEG